MAIYIGTTNVTSIYFGTQEVKEVYFNSNLVFSSKPDPINIGINITSGVGFDRTKTLTGAYTQLNANGQVRSGATQSTFIVRVNNVIMMNQSNDFNENITVTNGDVIRITADAGNDESDPGHINVTVTIS